MLTDGSPLASPAIVTPETAFREAPKVPAELLLTAKQLLSLYRDECRPFLQQHLPVAVEGLDRRAELLKSAVGSRETLDVGFVGESQVGKSTLLNALIGEYALPSGGVGPLTAQAIHVRHSEEPFFVVQYHGRKKLNEARFAIESSLSGEAARSGSSQVEGDRSELSDAVTDEAVGAQGVHVADALVRSFEEVFGITDGERAEGRMALQCLRLALGQGVNEPLAVSDLSQQRIREVQGLIGQEVRVDSSVDHAAFRQRLRSCAAGYQSPLVAGLELHLSADVLRALHLVDLPGVGTINDPAQNETKRFVRTGDALAIVVRNNGITEAVVNLLERSEFISRWIWHQGEDSAPIHALVIVTHLDDVARGRYSEAKRAAHELGERPPSKEEIFREISDQMVEKVRTDLRAELMRSPAFVDLEGEDRARRQAVVDNLCDGLRVHCVAAPDALELEFGDENDAFLRDLGATGVPRLRQTMVDLAGEHTEKRREWIQNALTSFRSLLKENIERAERVYEEAPEVGVVARFRQVADPLLPGLEARMQGLHGRCMSRLSEGIPDKIEELCLKAELAATKKLQWMRRHAEGLHYQSLNAALRRSGRWDNRGVDYPGGITRAFVDTVAGEWTAVVVTPVKETLSEAVDEDSKLVEELVGVARGADPRLVETAQVDGFVASMREAAESCVPWSEKRLGELRANVEAALSEAVADPIAEACEEAIDAGRNRGTGAKQRIINVFEDSGTKALSSAKAVAIGLLKDRYGELYSQLHRDYLGVFENPVRKVYDEITKEINWHQEAERERLQETARAFAESVSRKMERIFA